SVATGRSHSCAVKVDGTAWCWGNNSYGRLGNGKSTNSAVPVQVSGIAGVLALATNALANHSCAVLSGGTAKCWGYNNYGELGNGGTSLLGNPLPVTAMVSNVSSMTTAGDTTCARLTDGSVQCFGFNAY